MYVFQWHIDVPFGKQKEVIDLMKTWLDNMYKDADMPKPLRSRLLTGAIGESPLHIIAESEYPDLSAFENTMHVLGTGRFQKYSESMAKHIVPGSQHWVVLNVADEMKVH